jgi:hydrogenase/urease accessory protein HupE
MRSHLTWMLASLLVWASCPGRASAHLVNSGLGLVYDGVAHLFVTPEDLLAVVALALLAGLGGKWYGRAVLFVLPAAWLAGALAGQMAPLSAGIPALSAALLIALGALVAADRRLPVVLVAGAALICGLLKGSLNGAALAGAPSSGLAAAGLGCAVFVTVALVAGQVAALEKEWARIAVRVAGSWIGAIGLLMLGWAAR